ncbi:MAG: hypothetical protein AB8G11_12935 [Saprospiraceae bacterium]
MDLGVGSRVRHPAYGEGAIVKLYPNAYQVCFMLYGLRDIGKQYTDWEIIEAIESDETFTFSNAEKSLIRILKQWSDVSEIVPIGDKWKGGTIELKPGDSNLKSKIIPIDTFFHKIVMVRDRLRVMEQRINSSKNLSADEKVNLQQYLTRIYGSLTTFNVLFKIKENQFRGERSK